MKAKEAGKQGWPEWRLLLVLAAVQFTSVVDFMVVMPLGPQLMRQWDLAPQRFGLLVSAYAFSASLSGLLAACFIDRFDRKRALLGLYAGFTAGTLLCAAAPNYPSLLLARGVAGAFGGLLAAGVLAVVADALPEARRGLATGVVMSAFAVASAAGVPCALFLANLLGWRAPFGALGGLSAAVLVAAHGLLPPLRGHLTQAPAGAAGTWAVLAQPSHVRAYALTAALVLSTFTVIPYLAAYLVANVGRPEADLPWVYLCGGATTLLTLALLGRLADRFGKRRVFRLVALVSLIPTLLVTNLPPAPLGPVLVVTTLFMVATSGRMVTAMALITTCAAPRFRGSFLSTNASVQQLASGLAALAAGALLGTGEGGALTGYRWVGALAAAATVGSVFLAGRLRGGSE